CARSRDSGYAYW
nr:immunoglobulin heavy chain junction region [Mus musculus]